MARNVADCRDFPSEKGCTLTIAGAEEEVLEAAVAHAVAGHAHENTPQLREQLRGMLQDEVPGQVLARAVLRRLRGRSAQGW